MKNLLRECIVAAAGLFALTADSRAQTLVFNGMGTSSLSFPLYVASYQQASSLGGFCSGPANSLQASDPDYSNQTIAGSSWIVWTQSGGTSCSAPGSGFEVFAYFEADSIVGLRCIFDGCSISVNSTAIPAAVKALFPAPVTTAASDIRPEDALFAMARATASCGQSFAGSRYLGMGYPASTASTISAINSFYSTSNLDVDNFNIPSGGYTNYTVGATPILVVVNQTDGTVQGAGAAGFADTNITNIESAVLANLLDGTSSRTEDFPGATGASKGVTVLIQPPISGAYNTMEYNAPNTIEAQSSQDTGAQQESSQLNCTSGGVKSNAMNIATKAGTRNRVATDSEMLSELFGVAGETSYPSGAILGYAQWSVSSVGTDFGSAYSGTQANFNTNARYLTVDGVDPIQIAYTGGTIPSTGGTGDVARVAKRSNQDSAGSFTMAHVADGSYPLWSFLRLICTSSCSGAALFAPLVEASPVSNFVPLNQMTVVRSHFLPPGIGAPCSPTANGTGPTTGAHAAPECGGDVGGVVYTIQGDKDYETDFQGGINVKQVGEVNRRR